MNRQKRITVFTFIVCFLITCLALPASAADKVVVIPLFGHGKPLKNIVTVAKADGKFTDPVAAVNSITDASENNPYLIVIGPGVYTLNQTLVMKPWVDICGSGENVTKLTGAISGDNEDESSAIVKISNDAVLSELTVENYGTNSVTIGAYSSNANGSALLLKMKIIARNGTYKTTGVYNRLSMPTMRDITVAAYGSGLFNIGVYNFGEYVHGSFRGSPRMEQVTVTGFDGTGINFGIYNYNCSGVMIDLDATAYGGTESYGIYNVNGSGSPIIRRSTLSGHTKGLYTGSGKTTRISQSTVWWGVGGSGTTHCVACDDGVGNPLICH